MDKLKNNNLTTNDLIEPILSDLASKIEEKADRDEIPEITEIEFPEEITINNFPEVQKVEITNFPEQKAPIVNVAPPQVNVNVPNVIVPEIKIPEINVPASKITVLTDKLEQALEAIKSGIEELNLETKKPKNNYAPSGVIASSVRVKNTLDTPVNPAIKELQQGTTSTVNSTSTALASAATYTGTWEQNDFPEVLVMVKTDNSGYIYFDFSSDGTNLDSTFPSSGFRITSGISEVHRAVKGSRYFRIRIVNDSGAQSYLRCITSFGSFGQLSAPLNQALTNDADASIVHSISDETDLMIGKYGTDRYTITKFGQNPLIDTGTVPEDIWNYGGVYTGFPTGSAETITVTSSATTSDAGLTLFLTGLDANYDVQSETITFNGSGVGVTANTYMRINRAYVVLPKSGQTTNVGDLTATHTTTTGNIFFKIVAGTGQTNLALYTIPAGYTGYLKTYRASMADATANNAQLTFWTRERGKAVRVQRNFTISTDYPFDVRLYSGVSFPEKTDFAIRCTYVKNNGASIQASFGLLLVKNT